MLRTRIITALTLAAALFAALFLLPSWGVALAFAFTAALCGWEWAGLMQMDKPARVIFALVLLLFCWQCWIIADFAYLTFWSLATAFWLAPAVFWLRRGWSWRGNDFLAYALGLILILAAWCALVWLSLRGPLAVIAALAIAPAADIAAFFVGRRFGRYKLAPTISPGKTIEGLIGGVAGVALYGLLTLWLSGKMTGLPWYAWTLATLLLMALAVLSVVGDLFESLLKRQAGVKDSSALLPGHGGLLDRLDSQFAVLPPLALLMYWSGW